MGDQNPGVWIGVVFIVAGLVLALVFTRHDALVLGGAGLIVTGALAFAISFEDSSQA